MYLLYYKTNNGERDWKFAQSNEDIDRYITENNLDRELCDITVDERGYEKLLTRIDTLEKRIIKIKDTYVKNFDEVMSL